MSEQTPVRRRKAPRTPPLTERDSASFGPRTEKPAGSVPWCWQTIDLLKIRWQRKDFTDQQFAETLAELRQQKVWEVVPPEQPYGSIDALLQAEIGYTEQEAMRRKVAETQALQPHGTNQHSNTGVDVVNSTSVQGGNSRDYLLARLKRDSPEIAEALARGEYPSVRAAAKAAGLISDPTPLTLLQRAWTKAAPADHQGFFRWLLERADQYMAERRTPDEPQAPLEALWDETIDVDYDDALVTQLLEVYDAAHAWSHDCDAAVKQCASSVKEKPDGTVVYEYPVRRSGEILDALWANNRAFIEKLTALSAVIDGYFSRADDSAEGQP